MAEEGLQNPEMLVELERVMALLAFTEPETSPFADVLLESQRFKVSMEYKLVKSKHGILLPCPTA